MGDRTRSGRSASMTWAAAPIVCGDSGSSVTRTVAPAYCPSAASGIEQRAMGLCLRRRFVLASWDCCFRRLEASFRVGAVAERLVSGTAAATQGKWTLGNRVGDAVPIDHGHIVALD